MYRNQKRAAVLLIIFASLFIGLILYLTYFNLFESEKLKDNSYNKRNWVDERKFKRGSIYDRNGELLTDSEKDNSGNYVRNNIYNYLFSHLIGYNSKVYGKTGIENAYNNYLLNIQSDNFINKLKGKVLDAGEGNSINLTIDLSLQRKAYQLLEGKKGCIVAMDPRSGEILAMVSRPSFDVNNLGDNWDNIVEDQSAPLLNRATQGQYTPGSIMKVITANAILESGVSLDYDDKGTTKIDGLTVRNYKNEEYGKIDLEKALVHSSNIYFASKSLEVGAENLYKNALKFGFNTKLDFDIPMKKSYVSYHDIQDKTEVSATAYGQGKTRVTPLHMAMVISSIANGGNLLEPKVIKSINSPNGSEIKSFSSKIISTVGTTNNISLIQKYLKSVVYDTKSKAKLSNFSVSGKTGTAQTGNNSLNNAWFIGYAPSQQPLIAVAVVVEDVDSISSLVASPIAGKIFKYWINEKQNLKDKLSH